MSLIYTTMSSFVNELRQENITIKKASDDELVGCVMVEFKIDNWEELTSRIEESDLYIDPTQPKLFGIEKDPHVSLLVGLEDGSFPLGQLISWLGKQYAFDVLLTGVSIFENKDYDVVKFDVTAKQLYVMHDYIAANFPNKEHFPVYVPHMTIAYVKAGAGKKYVQRLKEPTTLPAKSFVYSAPDRKKTKAKPLDTSSQSWMTK